MNIKAVLFDLDGTLLPQDQNVFIGVYFKELIKALSPLGADARELEAAVWQGTGSMIKNDGSKTNEQAFFDTFRSLCRVDMERFSDLADSFYSTNYKKLAKYTAPTPLASQAVEYARRGGRAVVLATNPLFPAIAQNTRIEIAGLSPDDFDFVTSYENEMYSKPNPKYYLSIAERLGVEPCECLMIGNDEGEDMYAASSVGMNCYLVEDCLIPSEKYKWQGERGSLAELVEALKVL